MNLFKTQKTLAPVSREAIHHNLLRQLVYQRLESARYHAGGVEAISDTEIASIAEQTARSLQLPERDIASAVEALLRGD